jgi:hypothetical protein
VRKNDEILFDAAVDFFDGALVVDVIDFCFFAPPSVIGGDKLTTLFRFPIWRSSSPVVMVLVLLRLITAFDVAVPKKLFIVFRSDVAQVLDFSFTGENGSSTNDGELDEL